MTAIREQRLELGGLTTRALELRGNDGAAAPPLLLLHGFSDSGDTWRELLRRFARTGRSALAVDMPGFGQASRLDRDEPILPQLDRFAAAAVKHLAEHHPGEDVVIAGNSLGGCVAMRAAENADLPLAGIVPIAPAGLDMARWIAVIESERLLRPIIRSPVPLPEIVVRQIVGRAYTMMAFRHPGQVDPLVVSRFTTHVRSKRDVVRILATGRRLRPELREPFHLERISCPVLLVWGDSDRMVYPVGADRVLRVVDGSRIEVIERCGHCPQVEAPGRLAEVLGEFPLTLAQAA
jgi:pimeloyl-ACP methyl ester carboxylesterase